MRYELFVNGDDLPVGVVNRQNPAILGDFQVEEQCPDLVTVFFYQIREWLSSQEVASGHPHDPCACSSVVERPVEARKVVGSIPTGRTLRKETP